MRAVLRLDHRYRLVRIPVAIDRLALQQQPLYLCALLAVREYYAHQQAVTPHVQACRAEQRRQLRCHTFSAAALATGDPAVMLDAREYRPRWVDLLRHATKQRPHGVPATDIAGNERPALLGQVLALAPPGPEVARILDPVRVGHRPGVVHHQ